MKSKLPVVIIGLVGVAAIVGAIIYAQIASGGNNANKNANANKASTPAKTEPGANPPWAKGAPNAVVTLEEFADFECGTCARFEPTMREIRTVYGDRVRVIFRQFPLQMHRSAYDAARAAEAAGQQGKFWEMHDLLFDKQAEWSRAPQARSEFSKYAQQLGLDVARFENDLTGQLANERIAADLKRGNSVGVNATPSAYLNGRKLEYPTDMTTARLRQLIDAALQQNKPQ